MQAATASRFGRMHRSQRLLLRRTVSRGVQQFANLLADAHAVWLASALLDASCAKAARPDRSVQRHGNSCKLLVSISRIGRARVQQL